MSDTLIFIGLAFRLVLFVGVLVYVSFTDLYWRRVPNVVTYPAIIIALCLLLVEPNPVSGLWGALVGGLVLLIPVLRYGPERAGVGDVKLALFIGLVLGFPATFYALFAAFGIGAIVAGAGLVAGRWHHTSSIPFAPFLALGAIIVWFSCGPADSFQIAFDHMNAELLEGVSRAVYDVSQPQPLLHPLK